MTPLNKYLGWPIRRLVMPNGDQIICLFCKDGSEPDLSVHDGNHNVFRLDKNGKVIWQITRIDYPDTNWESKHQRAREKGEPGCIEPFIRFYVTYADGTTKTDLETGMAPDVIEWLPGCKVKMSNLGYGTQWFTLDVDTGVATEITPRGSRAW